MRRLPSRYSAPVPSPSLTEVVAALEARYPPALAETWDAVGLICGDPSRQVERVLFAVDPTEAVAQEAAREGVDLIVTHHPLFLTPVHGVAALTASGRLVHGLIERGCALFAAHTNADRARPGVSDALADLLGVHDTVPLQPDADDPTLGLGRVGTLDEPLLLSVFVERVAARLPDTAQGVRAAGDPDLLVERVAVCGGSGDSLQWAASAAGADVYVSADAKHHRTSEHLAAGGCALVDVAHWASEWPWLAIAAAALADDFDGTVRTSVSTLVTDPWSWQVRSRS